MQLPAFTLLAISIAIAVQWGLDALPYTAFNAMHGFGTALFFLSPVIVTAVLAYAMRISNLGYVIFLAILSPFVSWILMVLFGVFVLNEPFYV